MCVSCTFRYEAQQGDCVNRERDGMEREEMETKLGVDMKGTRCDSAK